MTVAIGAYVVLPASILPLIMDNLEINETFAGWLVSIPQLAATLFGIPVGILLDRRDTRTIILLAVIVFVIATVWAWIAGIANAYWVLLGSRFVGGVALVTVWLAGTDLIGSIFSETKRATALSFFVTGFPAGYSLGFLTVPYLTTWGGWPLAFLIFGGSALGSIFLFVLVEKSIRYTPSRSNISLGGIHSVLTNRTVLTVCGISFIIYFVYMMFVSWTPTYIYSNFDIALALSSIFAAFFPAIGIFSRMSGGVLSDYVFDHRRQPIFLLSFIGTTVATLGIFLSSVVITTVVSIVFVGFFVQLQVGILFVTIQDVIDRAKTGTALALVSVVGWFGTFISPGLTGFLFRSDGDFRLVVGLVTGMSLIGIWLVLTGIHEG